jgi:hypothetical protein
VSMRLRVNMISPGSPSGSHRDDAGLSARSRHRRPII